MKYISILASALLLSFSANAAFTEGVEFQTLPTEAQFNSPNSVIKIYSINCPFCYKYEKAGIPNNDILPKGIEMDQFHIKTKPPFGLEKSQALAIALTKSEADFKKVKAAYYDMYHVKKKKFTSSDETIEFALPLLNMSKSEFVTASQATDVKAFMDKWDQGVEVAKIQGIPAITVNGKYLINTKSITSMDMLKSLISELSQK